MNAYKTENYYQQATKKEERKLNKQRNDSIKEAQRILKLLKRRRFAFKKEREYIERRMIPYISKMKFMPNSYRRMLDAWEERYNES